MKDQYSKTLFAAIFSPRLLLGFQLYQAEHQIGVSALYEMHLQHLELEHLTLFNPSRIGATLQEWYNREARSQPFFCALTGPLLQEHMYGSHSTHPSFEQFPITHSPSWHWDSTHIFSRDHTHYFFLIGLPKPILFQFQLLALSYKLPISLITGERLALLNCYRRMFGSAYRTAQLSQSLQENADSIEKLFHKDDLRRIFFIPQHIVLKEYMLLPLLAAGGLFSMQKGLT